MGNDVEQRAYLKLCAKNGISCAEALKKMRKTYNNNVISKSQAYKWYKDFKYGREKLDDLPHSGRPSTSSTEENINKVKELLLKNHQYSLRELAYELNISHESVRTIVVDILGMKRVGGARLISKEQNFPQAEQRKNFAESILNQANEDSTFLKRVITGGDICLFKTREPDLNDERKPKKSHKNLSNIKIILTVFFDHQGIIHTEFLLNDERPYDNEYHKGILERLKENIQHKRKHLWQDNSWILHYKYNKIENINDFLQKNFTTVIEQPSYSSDMEPVEYFLSQKLKLLLRKTFTESTEALKQNIIEELESIPEYDYKKCFDDWLVRCRKCIALNGSYIEEDQINDED